VILLLTFGIKTGYAGSLKTVNTAFAPVRLGVIFMPFYGLDENRKYIEYRSKHLLAAFSESARCSISTGILRKVNKMMNTIKSTETTIQSLNRYYEEMKATWYKGDYTIEQEEFYNVAFNAISDAIINLPPQCEEDRQIKLKFIADIITNEGDIDDAELEQTDLPDLHILQTVRSMIGG